MDSKSSSADTSSSSRRVANAAFVGANTVSGLSAQSPSPAPHSRAPTRSAASSASTKVDRRGMREATVAMSAGGLSTWSIRCTTPFSARTSLRRTYAPKEPCVEKTPFSITTLRKRPGKRSDSVSQL